jgi:hypothetical protein
MTQNHPHDDTADDSDPQVAPSEGPDTTDDDGTPVENPSG